jgi:predicted regulator of Ras-like GTPase activity (Roadblock/LC7/MglB family)
LQTGDVVHLPLNDILAQLPAAVAPLLLARPGGTFSLPVRNAVEQLGTGAVRVRLAQLRQSTPPGTFAGDTSRDETLVELPLSQILAAIGPAAFPRRSQQRATVVPEDVTGVFGPRGATLTVMPSQPASAVPPSPFPPAIVLAPLAPKPSRPALPPMPALAIKPISPETLLKPPTPAPLPFAAPKAPSPLSIVPRPTPAAPIAEAPKPAPPAGDEDPLVTTIGAICRLWPDAIRQEIEQFSLGGAYVSIPMNRLETGMKTGRVVFTWNELVGWLNPPPSALSPHGMSQLELPLNVIAPLFVGKRRALTERKKISIDQNIPDLFAGFGKPPAPAPAPAPVPQPPPAITPPAIMPPVAAPPVPVAPVAAVPAPAPAPVKNALGELLGQPTKADWSPQEIARHIASLPGVSGSLLATADGLLVAGQVPPPLDAETLAAFLPQILGRISTYSAEVKLGALFAVTMSTDSAPCVMLKAGALRLAVVGKRGQSLPEPVLLRIAAQLDKHNP